MTDQPQNGQPPAYNHKEKQKERALQIIWTLLALLIINVALFILARLDLWFFKSVPDASQRLIEWVLASAGGTFIYLLMEAAPRYGSIDRVFDSIPQMPNTTPEEKEALEKKISGVDYIGWTPWYGMNAIRGPIIAMVVMVALTNVSLVTSLASTTPMPDASVASTPAPVEETPVPATVEATPAPTPTTTPGAESASAGGTGASGGASPEDQPLSLAVDLTKASQEVLLIIAFILGWQSRLSVALLETIGRRVFGEAWKQMENVKDPGRQGD